MKTPKLTKQGVRDLSDIGPKRVVKKLEMPPAEAFVCPHPGASRRVIMDGYIEVCDACHESWDVAWP